MVTIFYDQFANHIIRTATREIYYKTRFSVPLAFFFEAETPCLSVSELLLMDLVLLLVFAFEEITTISPWNNFSRFNFTVKAGLPQEKEVKTYKLVEDTHSKEQKFKIKTWSISVKPIKSTPPSSPLFQGNETKQILLY